MTAFLRTLALVVIGVGVGMPAGALADVFDNDGTLWSEQPLYFQLLYALDVLREKAEADPSILTSDVLAAAAEGDMAGMMLC